MFAGLIAGTKNRRGVCLPQLIRPDFRSIPFVIKAFSSKQLHTHLTKLLVTPHSPATGRRDGFHRRRFHIYKSAAPDTADLIKSLKHQALQVAVKRRVHKHDIKAVRLNLLNQRHSTTAMQFYLNSLKLIDILA